MASTRSNGQGHGHASEDLMSKFGKAAESVTGKFEDAQEQLEDLAENLGEKSEELWTEVTDFVEEHPGKALTIALLAGIVLGVLIRGGSRE